MTAWVGDFTSSMTMAKGSRTPVANSASRSAIRGSNLEKRSRVCVVILVPRPVRAELGGKAKASYRSALRRSLSFDAPFRQAERQSVGWGKSVSVRGEVGGDRSIKTKTNKNRTIVIKG